MSSNTKIPINWRMYPMVVSRFQVNYTIEEAFWRAAQIKNLLHKLNFISSFLFFLGILSYISPKICYS